MKRRLRNLFSIIVVAQIIWFSREIANAEELPSNYFTQGKMVIDPSNPERFSISFSNNHPSRALHCRDFAFVSGAAELSFCSDPNAVGLVTSKLPNFTIDSKARTMLADLGADAVEGYKLANGLALTSQINLCDGIPTQKSGMCEFGCGPAAREQSGTCIRICANGLDYGTTKSGRFGCYYRTMTCSKEGDMSCTETYRPGPGCPMIEDPGPHFCNDDWT